LATFDTINHPIQRLVHKNRINGYTSKILEFRDLAAFEAETKAWIPDKRYFIEQVFNL
jgi:hypothetical protein